MRDIVLFHANCSDGFCAAWIAHRKLGDSADYIPVQYGQDPPDEANDKHRKLFILDFSYSRDVIFRLAALRYEEMVVLDHHKTAQAALRDIEIELVSHNCGDALTVRFDMEKSGARLAWEYFFPGEPAPWLVDYTEDRDLWRWRLPHSKEINAALASYPRTFDRWDDFHAYYGAGRATLDTITCEGAAILRYQEQQVDAICRGAREVELGGHTILAANTSVLFSEVAGKLAERRSFGAAWFIRADGKRQWSLRSREGGLDVSEIAKQYGGGGHRNAAGFEEALNA